MKEVLLIAGLVFCHNGSARANNRSFDLTALNIDISIVLQNLLDDHHPEYRTKVLGLQQSEVTRSIYLKTTWWF